MFHSGRPRGALGPPEHECVCKVACVYERECVCEDACVCEQERVSEQECVCEGECVCEHSVGRRKCLRRHIRDTMEQLEYVLSELKDVARELQEVVVQIDKLTGDMDLDAETDESTAACSSGSSERGPSDTNTHTHPHTDTQTHHHHHYHLSQDTLSDSCSLGSAPENPLFASGTETLLHSRLELRGSQSQLSSCGAAQVNGRNYLFPNSPKITLSTPNSPKRTFFIPSSVQGSCYSPNGSCYRTSSPKGSFTSPLPLWVCVSGGGRRFSEQELDHALCCDDDDEDVEGGSSGARSSRLSSADSSVFSSTPLHMLQVATLSPTQTRTCATQTVSDKSTQTDWPYVSPKVRRWSAERS
ncbi:hypothetical protein ACEWY4_010701 [Coilia grayii]|uniref:Inhibitory synaptic factor 1 n=1 Tax=Coilia grayii TaxID=363190 RepID=A0ABD1K2M6_9TELE